MNEFERIINDSMADFQLDDLDATLDEYNALYEESMQNNPPLEDC